jgi:hypothetical protein
LLRLLAVWRLTELVVEDEVTRAAREWVALRFPRSRAVYLVRCRACVSVWAGLAVVVMPAWLIDALAGSAATILLGEWRDERASAALGVRMRGGAVDPQAGGG